MLTLHFARTESALLKNAHTLMVIAPEGRLKDLRLGFLDRRARELAARLGDDLRAGDLGAQATTLLPNGPNRLIVAALPDRVSRHNAPSRAEAIRQVVSEANLGQKGKAAIVVVLDDLSHLLAALNAVNRGLPSYSAKSTPNQLKVHVLAVDADETPIVPPTAVTTCVEQARAMAELVDTPPTELDPEALARHAIERLRGCKGVKLTEFVGDALLEQRLGGIHAVGRCALSAPRMIVATYTPSKSTKTTHLALVGKGVTYDTGGLHIKGRGIMETMKMDMGGAAAVLGAFCTVIASAPSSKISLVLCLAENAIGPAAYKPDDILTLHSGKTVEINNTDAEGRLLLGDGVSYAARNLGATVILDAATLTGAQLVATGLLHAGIVSDDEALERLVLDAGRHTGDLCHPLPFVPEFFRKEFKSPIADMRNSVANRNNAQSSCAAQFVYNHLEGAPGAASRRWCHIDLAGPAYPKDRASGYGVALLSEVVRRLDADAT